MKNDTQALALPALALLGALLLSGCSSPNCGPACGGDPLPDPDPIAEPGPAPEPEPEPEPGPGPDPEPDPDPIAEPGPAPEPEPEPEPGPGPDPEPEPESVTVTAYVTDPPIVGAVMCIDTNRDGFCEPASCSWEWDEEIWDVVEICEGGDPLSTPSDADGRITWELDAPLGANTLIVAQWQPTVQDQWGMARIHYGYHAGLSYGLGMAALVDAGADEFVISPMTTLHARTASFLGDDMIDVLTPESIVQILQVAGLPDIAAADIAADPMSAIAEIEGTATEADLARVRAAMSMYAFMRIHAITDGVQDIDLRQMTPAQLLASGTNDSGVGDDDVFQLMSSIVSQFSQLVSPAIQAEIQTDIDGMNAVLVGMSLPTLQAVTAEDIVFAAVPAVEMLAGTVSNITPYETMLDGLSNLEFYANALLDPAFGDPTHMSRQVLRAYTSRHRDEVQAVLDAAGVPDMTSLFGDLRGQLIDEGLACVSGDYIWNEFGFMEFACVTQE